MNVSRVNIDQDQRTIYSGWWRRVSESDIVTLHGYNKQTTKWAFLTLPKRINIWDGYVSGPFPVYISISSLLHGKSGKSLSLCHFQFLLKGNAPNGVEGQVYIHTVWNHWNHRNLFYLVNIGTSAAHLYSFKISWNSSLEWMKKDNEIRAAWYYYHHVVIISSRFCKDVFRLDLFTIP